MIHAWIADALAAAVLDFAGQPLYVLADSELPGMLGTNDGYCVVGGFSHYLSLVARDSLQERGQWRGIGVAVIVTDLPDVDTLAVSVHEVAHALLDGPPSITDAMLQKAGPAGIAKLSAFFRAAIMPNRMPTECASSSPPSPPWLRGGDHSLPFIRTAAHVAHRLHLADHRCSGYWIMDDYYGLSPFAEYAWAMRGECQERVAEPIRKILLSDPPPAAVLLFQADVAQYESSSIQ